MSSKKFRSAPRSVTDTERKQLHRVIMADKPQQCMVPGCKFPGRAIDYDARPRTPLSPSVDHIFPAAAMAGMDELTAKRLYLDPANCRPAHYGCNASRGAGPNHKRPRKYVGPQRSSSLPKRRTAL